MLLLPLLNAFSTVRSLLPPPYYNETPAPRSLSRTAALCYSRCDSIFRVTTIAIFDFLFVV